MESNVQPSFIPKKPLTQTNQKPVHHVSLISLIATIIFVTVIVIAGAVFGLKQYQQSQLEKRQTELNAQLDTFEPSLVSTLYRLDTRFNSANDLLSQHLGVSAIFTALGNATLKNVRFATFTFSSINGPHPTISMLGQAQNFTAVAQQIAEFHKPENIKYFHDVSILNPTLDPSGNVGFAFSATVDPQYLTYVLLQKDQGGLSVSSTTPIQETTTAIASSTASTTKTKSKATSH